MQEELFMDFRNAIYKIRKELQKPLPGEKLQYLMVPEIRVDNEIQTQERDAAVLICLIEGGNDLHIILIKRTEYDGPHSGQISFPGGMSKESDRDLQETALRETREEIGISGDYAEILGSLSPLRIPVSNTIVYPFVAFIDHEPIFITDEKEVSYLILARLRSFLDPANLKKEKWLLSGKETEVPFFQLGSNKIWGATAMILSEFMAIIAGSGIYAEDQSVNPDE